MESREYCSHAKYGGVCGHVTLVLRPDTSWERPFSYLATTSLAFARLRTQHRFFSDGACLSGAGAKGPCQTRHTRRVHPIFLVSFLKYCSTPAEMDLGELELTCVANWDGRFGLLLLVTHNCQLLLPGHVITQSFASIREDDTHIVWSFSLFYNWASD